VRLDGTPLGYVHTENGLGGLEAAELASDTVQHLEPPLWRQRVQRQLIVRPSTATRESITVIVCTRDRARDLDACLTALAAQTFAPVEVIVVDNAPRDDSTREVTERHGFRHVVENRPGLNWARNAGLRAARGSIVAYVDDDARPSPGWLAAIADTFAWGGIDAVTGLVVPAELETQAQQLFEDVYGGMGKGFETILHSRRGRSLTFEPHRYGAGCNMAFRRDALWAFGGFDPALETGTLAGGGGDLDALQRVIENNGTIVYQPDATVTHIHRRTVRQLRRQVFDNGRGYAAFYGAAFARARGRGRLEVAYSYLSWLDRWLLRRAFRGLLRREPFPLSMILAELAGFLIGPALYPVSRRRARRIARAHAA
jgi:glycosyltransferase involved in cell wall biosynthesis